MTTCMRDWRNQLEILRLARDCYIYPCQYLSWQRLSNLSRMNLPLDSIELWTRSWNSLVTITYLQCWSPLLYDILDMMYNGYNSWHIYGFPTQGCSGEGSSLTIVQFAFLKLKNSSLTLGGHNILIVFTKLPDSYIVRSAVIRPDTCLAFRFASSVSVQWRFVKNSLKLHP